MSYEGHDTETIYAIATPPGRSGVAIVRVSGPLAEVSLAALTGRAVHPRIATHTRLRHHGVVIDDALVLYFPAPHSFTGETVVEYHTHGSPAVLAALTRALAALGARPADAGAFTRRAFENGKMDLTQVEGLADLLEAETDGQRRQALRLQGGGLARATEGWIHATTDALAQLEALIDFADEGDVADAGDLFGPAKAALRDVATAMETAVAGASKAERMRDGLRVVVAGPPNVGKSTLLNALAEREVAIVTDRPGTTRDAIDIALDLGGVPVLLTDTAGLRETEDPVEKIGVSRAKARLENADLVLWLDSGSLSEHTTHTPSPGDPARPAAVWLIATKADIAPAPARGVRHRISAATGEGMTALIADLTEFAADLSGAGEAGLVTRERQRLAIEDARRAIVSALVASDAELAAEDLRAALHALHRLTGRFDVESVLDALFSSFCIGK